MENNRKRKNSLFALEQGLFGNKNSPKKSQQPTQKKQKQKQPREQARAYDTNEAIELQYDSPVSPLDYPEAISFSAPNSFASELEDESLPFTVEAFEADEEATPQQKITSEQMEVKTVKTTVVPPSQTPLNSARTVQQPTTVNSSTSEELSDAQAFAEDLQAVLNGEKTYDTEQKGIASTPPSPARASHPHDIFDKGQGDMPPPQPAEQEPPSVSHSHALFDEMGQNMAHATDFDQGTLNLSLEQSFDEFDRILDEESESSSKSQRSQQHKSNTNAVENIEDESESLTYSLAKIPQSSGIAMAMSVKTNLQNKINGLLTEKLNEEPSVRIINAWCIQRLYKLLNDNEFKLNNDKWVLENLPSNQKLKRTNKEVEPPTNKFKLKDHIKFFVKGGTSLGLLFENDKRIRDDHKGDISGNPSDWDTQLVINPNLEFDDWYFVLQNIEKVINNVLIEGNMFFSLHSKTKKLIQAKLPKAVMEKHSYTIKSTSPEDLKSVHVCEYFHPMQPSDISRRLFANQISEKWMRAPAKDIAESEKHLQSPNLFESTYPVETTKINLSEYSKEEIWKEQESNIKDHFPTTEAGSRKRLASMQKTLTIPDFYLYRLLVHYEVKKEEKEKEKEKLGSGKFRAELIDISIPRRDSYECQHHWLEFNKHEGGWEVIPVDIKNESSKQLQVPILEFQYHLDEQILMIREILAHKSSSPHKIDKRLKRVYYLALIGVDNQRDDWRMTLVNRLQENFEQSYYSQNSNIEELTAVEKLIKKATDEITHFVKNNLLRSAKFRHLLKPLEEKILGGHLDAEGLERKMLLDIFSEDNSNFWSKEEEEIGKGMTDCWKIIAYYSVIAEEIEKQIKKDKIDLEKESTARKNIKKFYNALVVTLPKNIIFSDEIYPHLTGRAASYYHLRDLEKVFEPQEIRDNLIVESIDWTIFVKTKAAKTNLDKQLKKGLEKDKEKYYQKYNIEIKSVDHFNKLHESDKRVEYAFGIPVINLEYQIRQVAAKAQSAEFLQSQQLKKELEMLQKAFSIREYGSRYKGMPTQRPRKLST